MKACITPLCLLEGRKINCTNCRYRDERFVVPGNDLKKEKLGEINAIKKSNRQYVRFY
jgi:hypothetical protein